MRFYLFSFFFPWIVEYNILWKLLRKQSLDNNLKLSFLQPAFKIHSLLWKKGNFLVDCKSQSDSLSSSHLQSTTPFPIVTLSASLSSCLFSLTADESLFSGFITVSQFTLCYLVWKAAESHSDSWKSTMTSLWYWNKRNQQAVVRLSYPSWLTYRVLTLHFFELDHHFFLLTASS